MILGISVITISLTVNQFLLIRGALICPTTFVGKSLEPAPRLAATQPDRALPHLKRLKISA
jgi:hypothetical protein